MLTAEVEVDANDLNFTYITPGIITDSQGRSWTVVVRTDSWNHDQYSCVMLVHNYEILVDQVDRETWGVLTQNEGPELELDRCKIVPMEYFAACDYYKTMANGMQLERELAIAEMKGRL